MHPHSPPALSSAPALHNEPFTVLLFVLEAVQASPGQLMGQASPAPERCLRPSGPEHGHELMLVQGH